MSIALLSSDSESPSPSAMVEPVYASSISASSISGALLLLIEAMLLPTSGPQLRPTFSRATTKTGKSTSAGNKGRNDPGATNAGNIFINDFSNFSPFHAISFNNKGKN
uniref:Uncharacterized protein n=1 Tax=Opuntia streptacantha TaxID=393608 RepID=A0A7C9EKD5_OPUST